MCEKQTLLSILLAANNFGRKITLRAPYKVAARFCIYGEFCVQGIEKTDVAILGEPLPRNKNTTLVEF